MLLFIWESALWHKVMQWMFHPHWSFFKSFWACLLEYCILRERKSTNKYICIVSRFWFCKVMPQPYMNKGRKWTLATTSISTRCFMREFVRVMEDFVPTEQDVSAETLYGADRWWITEIEREFAVVIWGKNPTQNFIYMMMTLTEVFFLFKRCSPKGWNVIM